MGPNASPMARPAGSADLLFVIWLFATRYSRACITGRAFGFRQRPEAGLIFLVEVSFESMLDSMKESKA
jgi:hypothetical protein